MSNQQIVMYSTTWCSFCRRAERVFHEAQVPFQEVNIEEDEQAAELVMRINQGNRTVPTIVFPDGTIMVAPPNRVLREKITSAL